MKKFALAIATLATVFSTGAMAATSYGQDHNRSSTRVEQRYENHQRGIASQRIEQRHDTKKGVQKVSYKTWKKGDRFESRHAKNYRVINAKAYGLRDAPNGYRWVQSDNDAVLIGLTSGVVAAVLANAIR
ncbi:RcnB family protein [Croceicoccus bisphenolivorans]|uniref:RcnB family protein n=1 Tax=Croceicoccus bisphenolivorans TaxID=1783232 RepID=UPI0008378E29|nr:RcnB family protein [Croceicoccus bisphenolivorans]